MAPNKDLALLKSLMRKKANPGGSVSQGSGTPSVDLDNIRVAVPLTQIPPGDVAADSVEEQPMQRQSARASSNIAIDPPVFHLSKRKQTVSEAQPAEARKSAKKQKTSRSSRHRSGPVPVDADFFKKNLEEYKVDPFAASANLFQHVAEVKNYEMAELKRKTQEELKKVEDKLEHTANLLRSKGALLDQAHNDLNRTITARDEYKVQAEEARVKIEEMKVSITGLETSKQELEEQVVVLKEQLKKLEDDFKKASEENASKTTADARIVELERELEEREAQRATAVDLAMRVAEGGFMNALEQIKLVYPDLDINPDWIRADCEVEDGKIVYEDPETERRTVIYPQG